MTPSEPSSGPPSRSLTLLSIGAHPADVVDRKLDALESQGYGGAYARKRIEASDGAFGAAVRCPCAEGFIRMSAEVHQHLPVTAHALELAGLSDHQVIDRASQRHGGP